MVKAERLPGTNFLVVRDRERTPERIDQQNRFLAAYSKCGNLSSSERETGVARRDHYNWLYTDIEYHARFRQARQDAIEYMEQEAHRRAVEGVKKPVYQHGYKVGEVTEYSDNLLMFLLKGAAPEKYRENWKGEEQNIRYRDPDLAQLSDEDIKTLHAIALKISQSRGSGPRLEAPGEDPDTDVLP